AELEKQQADILTVTQKAGVDGRLFGSVTNIDIAEGLKAQGHEVAKSEVRMPSGPLKTIGDFPVSVALHHDVVVDVTVTVVPEA
ncbi:MAG TPA: 50S ribosomal protein L9, partial [Methylophilaceae bacterium]|nr:50S ribosomal protein L9 [Methylophilaceae bacterium]